MTQQYRTVPYYDTPLDVKGNTHRSYYRWFQDMDNGLPPAKESSVTPTGSPFVYLAPRRGYLIVTGGTVQAVAFSRSGTFYNMGQTTGCYPLNQNDQLQITYTSAPTLTWVPT